MNKVLKCLPGVLALTLVIGCDWTTGGGVDSWNSRYNWVNFSGVYRGVGGGLLVSDFTVTPGTPGVTNSVSNERVATADGVRTAYNGVLARLPIVPGSVTISTAGFQLQDDGEGGLAGGGKTGSITYGTGAWSVDFGASTPSTGSAIVASYQFSLTGTPGASGPGSGASGRAVRTFTVFQEGETLQITDNNGATYRGQFGSVRTAGGAASGDRLPEGGTIIAQFTARGTSAAGLEVRMTGTFQAAVGNVSDDGGSGSLSSRQMYGTWIESGGRTGDINGQASPIPVTMEGTGGGQQ